MPKNKPTLKLVKTNSETAPQALESTKKQGSKGTVCKEFDCSHKPQVSGYCRLHFIKFLKQSTAAARAKAEDSADDSPKKGWNRRRGNRVVGLDQPIEQDGTARDEMIQHLGTLDDDFGTLLETEELNPFKKTG